MSISSSIFNSITSSILSSVGGGSLGRLVYYFGGASEYITVPKIDLVLGDYIEFKHIAPDSIVDSVEYFIAGDAAINGLQVGMQTNGTIAKSGISDLYIDGILYVSGEPYPIDGLEHTYRVVSTGVTFVTFLARGRFGFYLKRPIYDLEVKAVSGDRFYPISDGWSENPVISDTLNGQDGVALNFIEARWGDLSLQNSAKLWVYLSDGQSTSIGTVNSAYNPKPLQPQVSSNHKMFIGMGSTGIQDRSIIPIDIDSLQQYEEFGEGGMSGYCTHGSAFFDGLTGRDTAWLPAGKGGAPIEDIDIGGAFPSYENQVVMLNRIKSIESDSDVRAVLLTHGSANYLDSKSEYLGKLTDFITNRLAAIAAVFPKSKPVFYFSQNGGERNVMNVMQAQVQSDRDGFGTCIGAMYWLHRLYPNTLVGVNGAPDTECLHLNVVGYQYLGEMSKRAVRHDAEFADEFNTNITERFKALQVVDYEWVSSKNLILTVHNPTPGATLSIDTSNARLPAFPGLGVEVEQPNSKLFSSTLTTVSGNEIAVSFPEDVLPGDRLRFGYTPEDIAYYGDFVPDPVVGSYPSAMSGTNIRSNHAVAASFGNADFYDWLCCDVIHTDNSKASAPAVARGNNCYQPDRTQGYTGWGSMRIFAGGVLTITRDGIDTGHSISRDLVSMGSTKESATWNILTGKSYEVIINDIAIDDDIAYFQVFIGGAGASINKSHIVNGVASATITATSDFSVRFALRERSGEDITQFTGRFGDITIKEVL